MLGRQGRGSSQRNKEIAPHHFLPSSSLPGKELTQDRLALRLEHPADDLDAVIQPRIVRDRVERMTRPAP